MHCTQQTKLASDSMKVFMASIRQSSETHKQKATNSRFLSSISAPPPPIPFTEASACLLRIDEKDVLTILRSWPPPSTVATGYSPPMGSDVTPWKWYPHAQHGKSFLSPGVDGPWVWHESAHPGCRQHIHCSRVSPVLKFTSPNCWCSLHRFQAGYAHDDRCITLSLFPRSL